MANTTSGGMLEWLKENPTFSIGAGVVLVLIIAGKFMQPKTPTTPNADLSGLKNGLVYVPTQTNFTTENIGNTTTTTNNTTTNYPPPTSSGGPPTASGGGTIGTGGVCKPGYHFQSKALGIPIPEGSYGVSGGYCVPDAPKTVPPFVNHKRLREPPSPVPNPPGHRNPPPPPPKPVAKYPIPGKSPFAYRYGERVFQWKDPWGHLWTVGFGPSGRVWGVPGSVSDAVWQRTPIPPKTLLYQD